MEVYKGNAASYGIAVGKVHIYIPTNPLATERYISREDVTDELNAYQYAIEKADSEINSLLGAFEQSQPDKVKIFKAHLELIHDEEIEQSIRSSIADDFLGSDWAIEKVYSSYAQELSQLQDPLIKERAADLVDVKKRLLRICLGISEDNLSHLDSPCIVV